MIPANYLKRIEVIHKALGIPPNYANSRGLPLQLEAENLVDAGCDCFDRPQRMNPETLMAWNQMRVAAESSGITLLLVSAYRSVDYQKGLIEKKLAQGRSIENILKISAGPGYSEHHTGRALDLNTPGCEVLEKCFEDTVAFEWLGREAAGFGFGMSYSKDNAYGIAYEPWHWCFQS